MTTSTWQPKETKRDVRRKPFRGLNYPEFYIAFGERYRQNAVGRLFYSRGCFFFILLPWFSLENNHAWELSHVVSFQSAN